MSFNITHRMIIRSFIEMVSMAVRLQAPSLIKQL